MDHKFKINENGNCRMCDKKDVPKAMINCHECDRWFHLACINLKEIPKRGSKWLCIKCAAIAEFIESQQKVIQTIQETKEEMKLNVGTSNSINLNQDIHVKVLEAIIGKIKEINVDNRESTDIFMIRQTLLELPEFDGSYKTWPRFKQTFYETTEMGKFSDLENINRLQKSLTGEALRKVNGLLMDSKNVGKIMTILEERFGSVELVYNELINEVLSLRSPRLENPKTMIDFVTSIGDLVTNMECLNHVEYLNDQRLIKDLANKLPFNLHQKWLMKIINNKEAANASNPFVAPTLKEFHDFLKPQEKLATALLAESGIRENKPFKKEKFERLNCHTSTNTRCMSCGQNHRLIDCPKFIAMSPENRRQFVFQKKICFSCCRSNHILKNCRYARFCNIDGCKSKHNRLLHIERSEEVQRKNVQKHVYYQIVPVTLINGENKLNTFAFFDSGSSVSLINSEVIDQLQVKGSYKPMTLAWTNGDTQDDFESKSVEIKIKGPNGKTFNLKDIRTVKNLDLPTQSVNMNTLKKKFDYLNGVEIKSYERAMPTILLGLPHAFLFSSIEEKCRAYNEPIARLTKLGWMLYGSNQNNSNRKEKWHKGSIEKKCPSNDGYVETANEETTKIEKLAVLVHTNKRVMHQRNFMGTIKLIGEKNKRHKRSNTTKQIFTFGTIMHEGKRYDIDGLGWPQTKVNLNSQKDILKQVQRSNNNSNVNINNE